MEYREFGPPSGKGHYDEAAEWVDAVEVIGMAWDSVQREAQAEEEDRAKKQQQGGKKRRRL